MKNHDKFGTLNGNTSENKNFKGKKLSSDYFENKITNYFDLKDFKVLNPYNLKQSIERIENLVDEEILNDLETFAKKEFDFDFNKNKNFKGSIDEMSILTSKKDENESTFIKLIDFNEYLNEEKDTKIEFNLELNETKKELQIKSHVNFQKFSENLNNVFDQEAIFDSSKNLVKIANLQFSGDKTKKSPKFDIVIKQSFIKKVFKKDERTFIIELINPPNFKSNFLKREEKNTKISEYENIIFPFRNFQHEVANLKYRKFYLLLKSSVEENDTKNKKENTILILNNLCNPENKLKSCCSLILKNSKISDTNIQIISEKDYRRNKSLKLELNEFFDEKTSNIFKNYFGFDEANYTGFIYQVYVIVSENILTYFNAIEFVQEILNYENYNYFKHRIDDEGFLDFIYTEAMTNLIDYYKDSEFSVKTFEETLKNIYQNKKLEYNLKGDAFKTRKNRHLIKSMRTIVTPTYTLFMPYVEDQGNRILREFCEPYEAMRLVFKMDDYQDARWNNRFLMEFIKHTLYYGVQLGSYKYQFFCYSQSQFRSMGCWLVINPDEILPKTGDYSNIKIVAKYGARVGLTLTSTLKTIPILEKYIKYIPDVKDSSEKYVFSDGIGTITYDLAKKISATLDLEEIPAAFQARFMGCKGVWTVLFQDNSSEISIRPSQEKFKKNEVGDANFFEVCSSSKFIKSYLNRQIIMLLGALGIPNEIFIKKLSNYRNRLEDEKFILSLIQYEEWNKIFMQMHLCGIDRSNDRLVRSIVSSNKEILYRDLKKKARIYIEEGAYVMGIMDEYGILEYGEAFLRISTESLDMILDKECAVAKCPCLHPGDIRKLKFVKSHPQVESTLKYKIFEQYKNVLIFPQKGKRPHTNEISGSDLDGDQFYIFYDNDLCNIKMVEPMDYSGSTQAQIKDNITSKDIINFFAEFINTNNLGLIADAHLAHADKHPEGANGDIAKILADKFSKAVDAPKTGDMITLTKDEEADKFPHYMGKNRNTYRSKHVLGTLYDMTQKYTEDLDKFKKDDQKFYDPSLIITGYEGFIFEGLIYFIDYFEDLVSILKKNEIQTESELLTGNNIDNDLSSFGKKRHNYDVIEKLSIEMKYLFLKYQKYFQESSSLLFKTINIFDTKGVFNNNFSQRASAFYYVSYNLSKIIEDVKKIQDKLDDYKTILKFQILEQQNNIKSESTNYFSYEMMNNGYDYYDIVDYEEEYLNKLQNDEDQLETLMISWKKRIEDFLLVGTKNFEISSSPNDENQYRILSFPWCTSGNILTKIKELA